MRKNISFEDIERQFRGVGGYDELKLKREHNYHKSYPYFVNYFKGLDEIEESHFVIAANFTYGWMPTILNFKPATDSKDFKLAVKHLNKAKGSKRLDEGEVLVIKALVNNSVVGTSKLLHFINPEVYAIWDSHVCRFITGKDSFHHVGKVKNFMDYLDECKSFTKSPAMEEAQENFNIKLDYKGFEPSRLRVIEAMMFTLGKKRITLQDLNNFKG